LPDHWSDEGLPTWDVNVGDRVMQGVDPGAAESRSPQKPPVGTLGTVSWVEAPTKWHGGPPEVWVRWDGVRYAGPEDSSMSTWIEPAPEEQGLQRGLEP
jgi:hypothetical protein